MRGLTLEEIDVLEDASEPIDDWEWCLENPPCEEDIDEILNEVSERLAERGLIRDLWFGEWNFNDLTDRGRLALRVHSFMQANKEVK